MVLKKKASMGPGAWGPLALGPGVQNPITTPKDPMNETAINVMNEDGKKDPVNETANPR
jgi:hypothetical protein